MFGFVLGVIVSFGALAGDTAEPKPSKPYNWKLYPLVYYTTETRAVAEIFSFVQFRLKDAHRSSNIRFVANYTQEKQYTFLVPFQLCFKQDKYFAQGNIEFTHYPEYFYGIGNQTVESKRDLYSFGSANIQVSGYKKVANHLFVGLGAKAQQLTTQIENSGEVFSTECDIPGKYGYKYFMLGTSLLYDSRDHMITARKGVLLDVSLSMANGKLSDHSSFSYKPMKLDFRYFHSPIAKTTFALRLLAEQNLGYVPFRSMSTLGGARLLRGYYYGRFRDSHLSAVESEFRIGPFARFGLALFGGLGKVGSNWENLVYNQWHSSYGMGFRYQLSKNDPANVRVDLGLTKDSYGVYIIFGEAF